MCKNKLPKNFRKWIKIAKALFEVCPTVCFPASPPPQKKRWFYELSRKINSLLSWMYTLKKFRFVLLTRAKDPDLFFDRIQLLKTSTDPDQTDYFRVTKRKLFKFFLKVLPTYFRCQFCHTTGSDLIWIRKSTFNPTVHKNVQYIPPPRNESTFRGITVQQ